MDQLLNSRLSRDPSPTKLDNLSPEKYGKGAYASLTFTPSKLVDNILYKEATNFKKIEQESSKVRQSNAFNSLLKDRLSQLQEERDGIEQTLTQQITMYKKMLNQNEVKHEQRLKDIQRCFNQEIQKIIVSKQEEAKYAQSEKQLLQGKIQQLENQVSELKQQLQHGGSNYEQLSKNHEKLQIHYKNICEKLEETEKRAKDESKKAKEQYEELSRKLFNTQVEFKGQLDKIQLQREREIENLQKIHKIQLQKIENKRIHEATIKNQELKDLTAAFEAEASRLKDIIENKDKSLQNLNNSLNQQKNKYINLTRATTEQITNLINQKTRLKQEIDSLNLQIANANQSYKDLSVVSERNIADRDNVISKLKDQIKLNQSNYAREKDQLAYLIDEIHQQNTALKSQNTALKVENDQLIGVRRDNDILYRETRNLKDLLIQSSMELEKCKEEFIRIGMEKDLLSVKVRQLGYQNESLHRMKIEKEQEARGWRDSYYLSRR